MSKFIIKTDCDLEVELPKELLDFSEEQLKFIKDFTIQAESAGVVLYGKIGLPRPKGM